MTNTEANSSDVRLAAWRYVASIAAMAAIWGLLLLIAWEGKPGLILAILLIFSAPCAATSQLALLVSLPVLAALVRKLLCLSLFSLVVWLTIFLFELNQSSELYLWLTMFSIQFVVVAMAGLIFRRFNTVRARRTRHFSLLTLIMTVTIVCVSLGLVRAVAAALEVSWEDFLASHILSYLSFAVLNASAVIGPLTALATRRVLFRMLLLIVGVPQAILFSLAIVALHQWALPDGQMFEYDQAAIFSVIQAVVVSLSLLPILLAPAMPETNSRVDPPLVSNS